MVVLGALHHKPVPANAELPVRQPACQPLSPRRGLACPCRSNIAGSHGCAVVCVNCVLLHRNTLFDVVLALLHVWVSISYEKWRLYLLTQNWRVRSFSLRYRAFASVCWVARS